MPEEKPLVDPYANLDDDKKARLNADIDKLDKHLIQSVCPIRGVLQQMVNMFIQSVVIEMRQRNITSYGDPNILAEFYAIVWRRTAAFTPGSEHRNNDQGTAHGTRQEAGLPANAPDSEVKAGSGGGRTGGKRGGSKAKQVKSQFEVGP